MILDERDAEIILALADNNMNESETARAMFMHRNTVVYHLVKVRRVTGLDPMNFYDLHKLVKIAKEKVGDEHGRAQTVSVLRWKGKSWL